MTRKVTDLSWDELDALAQEAAEDAIDRAHDAGISTFGSIEGHFVACTPERVLISATPSSTLYAPYPIQWFDHPVTSRESAATASFGGHLQRSKQWYA